MKGPIFHAALFTAAAFFYPLGGFAQQPPGMVSAVAKAPHTEGGAARAHSIQPMPARPGVAVAKIEVPDRSPSKDDVERPPHSGIKQAGEEHLKGKIDEDALLLPVLHYGFWAMPPGGMTRNLISPPVPVDPDDTGATFTVVE